MLSLRTQPAKEHQPVYLSLLRTIPGIGYLKWVFSEAVVLYLRGNEKAQHYLKKLQKRMPKAKALSILAHKLGRTAYFMLKNRTVFDEQHFLAG